MFFFQISMAPSAVQSNVKGSHYKKAHGKSKSADCAAAETWVANRYDDARIFSTFCVTIRAIFERLKERAYQRQMMAAWIFFLIKILRFCPL